MKTITEFLVNNHVQKNIEVTTKAIEVATKAEDIRPNVYIKTITGNGRLTKLVKIKKCDSGNGVYAYYAVYPDDSGDSDFIVTMDDYWSSNPFRQGRGLPLYKFNNEDISTIELIDDLIDKGKLKLNTTDYPRIRNYRVYREGIVKDIDI